MRKACTYCSLFSAQATRDETAKDFGGTNIPRRITNISITNHALTSRCVLFLGDFAKLRKAIISFVMSVRPSVRMERLGSHWTDFHANLIFVYFAKICRGNSSLIEIWKEQSLLYKKINIRL